MNRLPALTGLRGVAALMIVAFHSVGNALGVLPGGYLGVDIFFVLSGFLITSLLLEEKARSGRVDYLAFYVRRALRLLPALFLVCLAAEVIATFTATPEQRDITRGQLLPSIFYFANWNEPIKQEWGGVFHRGLLDPNWSLSIEEQFYVIWPITLAFLMRFNRKGLIFGLLVIAFLEAWWGETLLLQGVDGFRVAFGSDTHTGGLLIGAAVGIARFEGWLPRPSRTMVGAAVVFLIALVFWFPYPLPFGYLACASCAAVLVAWVATGGQSLLASKPLVLAGTISYGMYLWSGPLLVSAFNTPGRSVIGAAGMAALTTLAAAAMYLLWERPFLKMQKRWRRSTLTVTPEAKNKPAGGKSDGLGTGMGGNIEN